MSVKVVLGLQNGDEGKGRIVDDLCWKSSNPVIVRFQGGNNAGHTIYDQEGTKSVVHGLPSGVLNPNAINIITRGCVINPLELSIEISQFKPENLIISDKCPIICPNHIEIDKAVYQQRLGTTAKGIGPAYADYTGRDSILLGDWIPDGEVYPIQDFIGSAEKALRDIVDRKDFDVILEGCQGTRLDLWGDEYPNCTSSCTTIGAVFYSTRLSPKDIDEVIGVAKVYETKVGSGSFKEVDNELGEKIREVGKEYGATTGRPRKIGWTDLDQLKDACIVNGVDRLILTKMDIIPQINKLAVWVDGVEMFFEPWAELDPKDEKLIAFLSYVQAYTGVAKIGYTFGENRGSIVEDLFN